MCRAPRRAHPPVAQIPALLDHVQDVGLSAGARQTGQQEDRGPRGRVRVRGAVVVVEPIQGDLSSIRSFNKLTAETGESIRISSLRVHSNTHANTPENPGRQLMIPLQLRGGKVTTSVHQTPPKGMWRCEWSAPLHLPAR